MFVRFEYSTTVRSSFKVVRDKWTDGRNTVRSEGHTMTNL